MGKKWIAAWAIASVTAGCAGSAKPVGPGGVATSATPHGVQQASWTERMTAPFKKNPFAGASEWIASKSKPKVDPAEKPFDPEKATPELHVGLAQMAHRAGNVPQARQQYQKALAKDPNHLEALLGAARMEDREGQLDVAMMLYKRSAAAHPTNAATHNDLALCFARKGDLKTAHQALEHAIKLDPAKPLYRNNIAKVLVELNGLNHAMHHLSAAHPPAVANYNMAVLLSERGRGAESAHYLTQALAIDPNMEPAQAMLAQHIGVPTNSIGGGSLAIAQTAPAAAPAPDNRESILPTPEAVATVPWKPFAAGDIAAQPTNASSPAATTPASHQPALLPPVN